MRNDCSRLNFLKNHIKNAIYLDLDNLKNHKTDLPMMMPDEKAFVDAMKRLNVKLTDTIVCYDTSE